MNWILYLNVAAVGLAGLVTLATVVAPLTKNKWDDKAVGLLKALQKVLEAFAVSFKK